ncbi:hypothetical protein EIP91_006435 [Steccherinum ochraceum]|uniref:Uncharacterized protein n=1 Tax=Steccherinum ochraceum TaxID=92696 RepID=A0A4R0R8F0_9APHY|nr:hypothetical protein EIP91_006435 [Steccherinum ochraceum]
MADHGVVTCPQTCIQQQNDRAILSSHKPFVTSSLVNGQPYFQSPAVAQYSTPAPLPYFDCGDVDQEMYDATGDLGYSYQTVAFTATEYVAEPMDVDSGFFGGDVDMEDASEDRISEHSAAIERERRTELLRQRTRCVQQARDRKRPILLGRHVTRARERGRARIDLNPHWSVRAWKAATSVLPPRPSSVPTKPFEYRFTFSRATPGQMNRVHDDLPDYEDVVPDVAFGGTSWPATGPAEMEKAANSSRTKALHDCAQTSSQANAVAGSSRIDASTIVYAATPAADEEEEDAQQSSHGSTPTFERRAAKPGRPSAADFMDAPAEQPQPKVPHYYFHPDEDEIEDFDWLAASFSTAPSADALQNTTPGASLDGVDELLSSVFEVVSQSQSHSLSDSEPSSPNTFNFSPLNSPTSSANTSVEDLSEILGNTKID